ncbi:MAG: dihydroorotate dehydrogenase-like protein, partial [Acidimicrobiia bacterium]|nr:dihydroorotate dehydrogenase-like protein [Acidimicrobiia bacterium]
MNLATRYLGLDLANPIVPSSSPLTREVESLERLEQAGAAAVVLPSLFEEQIEHETMAVHAALNYGAEISAESTEGYFPEMDDYNTGASDYVEKLRSAKEVLSIPVIASLNGTTHGGWTLYARVLEEAGADALELNIYMVAADAQQTGAEVEAEYLRLVEAVRAAVNIPLAVKIGPFFSSVGNMASRLTDAGADGLVLFNRFYQPDINLELLSVEPNLVLSSSDEMRLVLRWMAILYGRVGASLAATTGVHTVEDVVKLILAGADVTMLASALLRYGPELIASLLDGLTGWLDERGYESVNQARG